MQPQYGAQRIIADDADLKDKIMKIKREVFEEFEKSGHTAIINGQLYLLDDPDMEPHGPYKIEDNED